MKPSHFLNDKIKKQLATNGVDVLIYEKKKNKYGEVTNEINDQIPVRTIKAIYHEANGYISENVSDSTVYRSKKSPMLLTDIDNLKILANVDVIDPNVDFGHSNFILCLYTNMNVLFEIGGILNIQEYNVAFDISLTKITGITNG